MNRFWLIGLAIGLGLGGPAQAESGNIDDLYRSQAVVTGQGEKNRQAGFRDCLRQVLVRVSGDQRLVALPEAEEMVSQAGAFVLSFSYRDRLADKPIHDEQGTYDRPFNLTCHYDPEVIDGLLARLGSQPWRGQRPHLAVFLTVKRSGNEFLVSRDNPRDEAMRQSFAFGALPLAMNVSFPSAGDAEEWAAFAGSQVLAGIARDMGGARPLVGTLEWSDRDFGWVATWRLVNKGAEHVWTVRGVNFDEAFRVAVRGAAQILSGNGSP